MVLLLFSASAIIAQPTVTSLNFYTYTGGGDPLTSKGHALGGDGATEVPLNYFIIETVFSQNVKPSGGGNIVDQEFDITPMFDLKLQSEADYTNDLFTDGNLNNSNVAADVDIQESPDGTSIILVRFVNDLLPNTAYTLRLNAGGLLGQGGTENNVGVNAQEFTFTTASAPSVTAGDASAVNVCNNEIIDVPTIVISEASKHTFARNTTGTLTLIFEGNNTNFEFITTSATVNMLGVSGNTATKGTITATEFPINYTIADDNNQFVSIIITGLQVRFVGSADETINIVAKDDVGRHNINGLYSQGATGTNAAVPLGIVAGKGTISDVSLNPSAIIGDDNHCVTGAASVFSVDPVTGANSYTWTVPTQFTPSGATQIGATTQWTTTTNSITLTPNTTTTGSVTLEVKATNSCRESATPSQKTTLSISNTLNTTTLNASAITGTTTLCSDDAGPFRYTVPPVAGATQYEWTIPAQFNEVGTINTANNFVDLTPASAGTSVTISVTATNGCLRGTTPGTINTITINSPTAAGSITFNTTSTGNFASGASENIANTAGTQTITVTGGTAVFSGTGIGGASNNEFYPSIVGAGGSSVISYTFTNTDGCTTTGTFTFNVFDANATISGVVDYCDNVTPTTQEFRVKTTASGYAIPTGNVVLQRTSPTSTIITQSVGNGFYFDRVDGSDNVFILVPATLGTGSYQITATNSPPLVLPPAIPVPSTSFNKTFTINAAPNPTIVAGSGSFTVCAATTSSYSVTATSGRTYSWAISGGGNISGGSDGSSVTINWLASTTGGTFNLSLTETNTSTGCARTVTQPITVNPQPDPIITPLGTNNNCVGVEQTYTASGGTSYLWNVNPTEGTITSNTGSQITVRWENVATGTVSLAATNGTGCQASVNEVVTVNALPVPSFTATAGGVNANSACVLATGQVYTINSVTSGHVVTWLVTGGTIQGTGGSNTDSGTGLTSVTIDWGNAVTGVITVTERNNTTNCEGVVVKNVTLNPLPSLVISGITANQQFCEGSPLVSLVARANGVVVTNLNNGAMTDVGTYSITDASNTTTLLTLPSGSSSFDPNDALLVKDAITGIGSFNLVFTFTDVNGCVNTITPIPFTVQPKPTVNINSTTSTITANAGESCARGTHTYTVDGGILPGNTYSWSVTGGIIINQAVDNSQIEVTWGDLAAGTVNLKVTNATSCEATVTANITINALPTPTFATGVTSACVSSTGQVYTINAVNAAHTVRWVVDGGNIQGGAIVGGKSEITGTALNSITVDWGSGAQGTITVTETDTKMCEGSVARIITLTPLPALTFTGINTTYCENDAAITLAPSVNGASPMTPGNGKFLVRDATNTTLVSDLGFGINMLTPAAIVTAAGTGTYAIVYQYTDAAACFNESSPVTFAINPVPKNVRVNVEKRFDSRDVIFSATADNVTPTWKWNWTFTGVTGNQQTDTLTLSNTDPQSVSYSLLVENPEGCQLNFTKVFNIDFSFQGKCLGTTTQFTDATTLGADAIGGRVWDFGDGNTSTLQNPTHTYAAAGTYFVKLTVTEGVFSYSLTKRIDIFPVVTVTPTATYLEEFTAGTAGWISHGTVDSTGVQLDRTSWQMKVPAGFGNIPGDKGNSWITDNTGSSVATAEAKYNANEQSYVESPCFNITALNRPMVSFDYFSDTDTGSDGVVLLYTIDDGTTWFRVGIENQGLEWYDTKPILGKPGDSFTTDNGDSQGWSGNTQASATTKVWKTARFGLDAVLNRMNAAGITNKIVRFRVAFGSNSDNTPNLQFDGFAFDNFSVNNRNRLVLSEFFINQTADADGALDLAGHNFAATKAEAINIHYHTDFPGADEINNTTEQDVSARSFHHGIRDVPRIVVDGVTRDEVPVLVDGNPNNWADSVFSTRTLINAPFLISVGSPTASGGTLTVNATVSAIEAVANQTVIHVVVIDSTVNLGGVTYYNAVRKMLPDGAGTFRQNAWALGDSQTLNYTWDYGSLGLDPSRFRVVVFVEDYASKEVYQAEVNNVLVTRTGNNNGVNGIDQVTSIAEDLKGDNVQMFPNPTNHYLNVRLQNKGISSDAQWTIISMTGQLMKRGVWTKGYQQIKLDISDLAEGVYIINVSDGKIVFRRKFEKH
ncbi:hypothetical protein BKI52_22370 [marine bacterium AO1-C]|nr:hypothetical protein BKI52_22370 [marine bacterium AO1-C]